jgi:hypothetical protein
MGLVWAFTKVAAPVSIKNAVSFKMTFFMYFLCSYEVEFSL